MSRTGSDLKFPAIDCGGRTNIRPKTKECCWTVSENGGSRTSRFGIRGQNQDEASLKFDFQSPSYSPSFINDATSRECPRRREKLSRIHQGNGHSKHRFLSPINKRKTTNFIPPEFIQNIQNNSRLLSECDEIRKVSTDFPDNNPLNRSSHTTSKLANFKAYSPLIFQVMMPFLINLSQIDNRFQTFYP